MIRVLIADDHAIVRKGLAQIASASAEIAMRGEASDFNSLMRLMKDEPCDVLLLDISMPGKNGIDVLGIVREQYPQTHILILSMYAEDQYAIRALNAGAAGYLTKDRAPECLVEAILSVSKGNRYITSKVADLLATDTVSDAEGAPHESPSDREFHTIRLIPSGKQLSQVADELALSPKTIAIYQARVLEKMKTQQENLTGLPRDAIKDCDLVVLLDIEADEFSANNSIELVFTTSEPEILLPVGRARVFVVALRELLANIFLHARATRVAIDLSATPTDITLQVRDNGQGLSPGALTRATTTGIRDITAMVDAAGGWLDISGAPGQGMTVKVGIPNHAQPDDPEPSIQMPNTPLPSLGGAATNQEGTAP